MCSWSCSRLHLSVSVGGEPCSPLRHLRPRERRVGSTVQRWMRNRFFCFFQGVMGGQKEAGGTKLRRWNKSDNAKMETDRETLSLLRVSTHSPFSGCESGELLQLESSSWNDIDSAWFAETNHMAKIRLMHPPPHSSPLFPFLEILSPPVWQLLKLHVHLTQKDPANVPLPRFNQSCFLSSWAALVYLEDRLLIQRDWDVRWGESTAVWLLNSSWTPIDSWGWSTFIEQAARKKRKKKEMVTWRSGA